MDKVIIITGGAGGIGSDICRGLAADGLKVVVADYAKDAAEKTAVEIRNAKGDAAAVEVDVGSKESVAEMMKQALAKYGQVDILFNGAGVMTRIPVVDMPEEEWDRVLRINLKGTFLCSQAAAKYMIPRKQGRILSIASGRGLAGQARASHYAASKAGIIAFTKSLAVELAPYDITVNAICPGAADTDRLDFLGRRPDGSFDPAQRAEAIRERAAAVPLGRLATADDVAEVAAFLAGDGAAYITGQAINVSGGAILH